MPSILRNLQILEVSGVDKGAGVGTTIVIRKRTPIEAASIVDTLNGIRRARRHAALAESAVSDEDEDGDGAEQQEPQMAKMETLRKAAELTGDDKIEFVKSAVERRALKTADVDAIMKAYVADHRKADESEARAHARLFKDDPVTYAGLVNARSRAVFVGSM